MKPCNRKIKHIAVALWTGFASGRDLLSGVLRYAQEHRRWSISIIQLPGETRPQINAIVSAGVDGIITSDIGNEAVARMIRETHAPVVTIEAPPARTTADGRIDYLTAHNDRIGELGAAYFLAAGRFGSYGFTSTTAVKQGQSGRKTQRELAFAKTISAAGLKCHSFIDFARTANEHGARQLRKWLTELPKPAAIMCFYDQLALEVLLECSKLKLTVPGKVSILGVDNDSLLCETASPPLSSIDPLHQDIGYRAAQHLDALIHGRKPSDTAAPYTINQVIVRESTMNLAPSVSLVRRAINFISAHATEDIGVEDVVNYLGVSRRLAFLRFREVTGQTIRYAIEDVRLDLAAKRLRNTKWTVARIARLSGYPILQTFGTAFRKRFQMTPTAYRSQHNGLQSSGACPQ